MDSCGMVRRHSGFSCPHFPDQSRRALSVGNILHFPLFRSVPSLTIIYLVQQLACLYRKVAPGRGGVGRTPGLTQLVFSVTFFSPPGGWGLTRRRAMSLHLSLPRGVGRAHRPDPLTDPLRREPVAKRVEHGPVCLPRKVQPDVLYQHGSASESD